VLSVLYRGTCVKGRSITNKQYSFVVCSPLYACVYVQYVSKRYSGNAVRLTRRHGASWPVDHSFNCSVTVITDMLSDSKCRKQKNNNWRTVFASL
jgi:hypothetical protein